jgi:hypothetical protein
MLVTDFDSTCLLQIGDKAGGFCLKRDNEYYLLLETVKSRERSIADGLAIVDMIAFIKIN